MTMHGGLVDQSDKFKKRVASLDLSQYKVISQGQLVVGFPIDEGVVGFQSLYREAVVSPAYGVWNLRHPERTDTRFLERFLRSPAALEYYKSKLRGSTARRRSLPTDVFLALPVPQPPAEEQRRIAAILDQVDALRTISRRSLALLDLLTSSAFRAMFGDPITNGRQVPQEHLGALAEVVTGNSPSRTEPDNFGNDVEWLKSDNLGPDIATAAEEGLSEKGRRRARVVPAGSILVTCIAGSPNSIGKSSMVDRDVAFNQQINAILPSASLDPLFLLAQLKTAPDLVRAKSSGGMKGMVCKSAFQTIELLVPPLAQQREFSSRVAGVQAQRVAAQHSLDSIDELFASLQARAFSGQL